MSSTCEELKNCPWCGEKPVYIFQQQSKEVEPHSFSLKCLFERCRANPLISSGKGYTKAQVTRVWNSYLDLEYKKKPKDLTRFNDVVSKKELKEALQDANCSDEVWMKYLPDEPYNGS